MIIKEGLTYDDVLLEPKFSTVESRSKVNLSVKLSKKISFKMPIIPANMKTVTGFEMAKFIADNGGLAILHRFMPIEDQLDILNDFMLMTGEEEIDYVNHVGFSVGVKKENIKDVDDLVGLGAKIICIDIAHGDSKLGVEMTKYIADKYPEVFLISGNVATGEGAKRLWKAGADAVKCGIGPGSLCSTRIETGNGVPQLSALIDVFSMKNKLTTSTFKSNLTCSDYYSEESESIKYDPEINRDIFIIADGGIKNAGDCVKALCFADMVMAGNLFAGTDEAPGEIQEINGKKYKSYNGSSTHKSNRIEGVEALVPYKGSSKNILTKLIEGIQSGCSYQGVDNLNDLKKDPVFIKITNAGLKESHPHDVKIVE